MTRKIIGYYSDAADQTGQYTLYLEVGPGHLACILRKAGADGPEAVELFEIVDAAGNWEDIFAEIRSGSQILAQKYPHTLCYYNLEEALLMPAEKFSPTAAADYLALVYGDKNGMEFRHEPVQGQPLELVYRVPGLLHQLLRKHFVLYQPRHVFTTILQQVMVKSDQPLHVVKLQFYPRHFNAAVFKQGKPQLIRSFKFLSPEDVLYYLTSITQQFQINPEEAVIEIGGMFDADNISQKQLHAMFSGISFNSVTGNESFLAAAALYPAYYFDPFYNLCE